MVKAKIPEHLPDCGLIKNLVTKASQRKDIDFDFIGILESFRKRVCEEARQINQLFPEYTPHDEQYHLKRLFHVADTVFCRGRYEEMNSAELFVLALSLYGHDWGMAVSEPEKQFIISGKLMDDAAKEDLWILPDERARFIKFAKDQRIGIDDNGFVNEISVELWREYVRQTHAFRSGERIRRYFDKIDRGVADATARVCTGHWLNFEDLQDYNSYPPNFALLRETVNLRALTIYTRLVDLLDLGEDRTPYIIWKFVAPRDPRSRMEWSKHMALRPITCPPYQDGRIITVDGSTDDNEVYAALKDLQIWCENQIRGSNDILARMNDPRHKLDIYHMDWRVQARGFEPMAIQFEFDRERMFEILGDEIYQGDPYVFLRELLQNSIDAIRMRREIIRKYAKLDTRDLGEIHVNVEHGEHGDAVVTWRDDGIGMDEYTIRNYLAIAGKSYYRSEDFEREGLEMDPISRFGVGLLSCFMVASRIEIETYKDPSLPPHDNPLSIAIPEMQRQFRIEKRTQEGATIGSTFRVFVEGKKLPKDGKTGSTKPLDITGYLKGIAGFVEFPIIVSEHNRKTIILHPKHNLIEIEKGYGDGYGLHQIDLTYPWHEIFEPQDVDNAREIFTEERLDVNADLNLDNLEGILIYLKPISDNLDWSTSSSGEDYVVNLQSGETSRKLTRLIDMFPHYSSISYGHHEGSKRKWRQVFRDGILLPKVPNILSDLVSSGYPAAFIAVNFHKSQKPQIGLSRMDIIYKDKIWHSFLTDALARYISETNIKRILDMDPTLRVYHISRLLSYHPVSIRQFYAVFPKIKWPMLFLQNDGSFKAFEWGVLKTERIFLIPNSLDKQINTALNENWNLQKNYNGILQHWNGNPCCVMDLDSFALNRSLHYIGDISEIALKESHELKEICFVKPPWEGDPPLFQNVFVPSSAEPVNKDANQLLEKEAADPLSMNPNELAILRESLSYNWSLPLIASFSPPYEDIFAYGWMALNVKHSLTIQLRKLRAILAHPSIRPAISPKMYGALQDAFVNVRNPYKSGVLSVSVLKAKIKNFLDLARNSNLMSNDDSANFLPSAEDFVPGTIVDDEHRPDSMSLLDRKSFRMSTDSSFGQEID